MDTLTIAGIELAMFLIGFTIFVVWRARKLLSFDGDGYDWCNDISCTTGACDGCDAQEGT